MKRDFDLIRNILLEIEKQPYDLGMIELDLPGFSDEEISYLVLLLYEAGLIDAIDLSSFDGVEWKPKRLFEK